jgi:hypothetical protein
MSVQLLSAVTLALVASAPLHAQHSWSGLTPEQQMRAAVLAAPEDMRAGATVQGWDASGAFVTLREGTNGLVCMAPDPKAEGFEVSCHHEGLEAFFARGRELLAQGVTGDERVQTRWKEHEAGKLPIPYGSVNYILTGTAFDAAANQVADPYVRWTIYTPGATPESTGLSTQPAGGGPWLMFPGTAGAHVMITPPRPGRGG